MNEKMDSPIESVCLFCQENVYDDPDVHQLTDIETGEPKFFHYKCGAKLDLMHEYAGAVEDALMEDGFYLQLTLEKLKEEPEPNDPYIANYGTIVKNCHKTGDGTIEFFSIPISKGRFDVFLMLIKAGFVPDLQTASWAITCKKWDIIKYIYENYKISDLTECFDGPVDVLFSAIRTQDYQIIEYVLTHTDEAYLKPLYEFGHTGVVYLITEKLPENIHSLIELLLKHKAPWGKCWDIDTISECIDYDHLELMDWCLEKGCPLTELAIRSAAKKGNLDLVRKLYLKGCPLSFDVYVQSLRHSNVLMKEYYLEHRDPEKHATEVERCIGIWKGLIHCESGPECKIEGCVCRGKGKFKLNANLEPEPA